MIGPGQLLVVIYVATAVAAIIWCGWQIVQGNIAALAGLLLWSTLLALMLNRLPQPQLPRLVGQERSLRAVALAAFGLGLLSADRGPLLWWCLAGLGALLLMLRWQWRG